MMDHFSGRRLYSSIRAGVMKYNNQYELIAGNTRLVALKVAGLPTKAWVFSYNSTQPLYPRPWGAKPHD